MKKIFLSALLFVMLISMSYELSYASCPSGYYSGFVYKNISGCNFKVTYCYKCDPTGVTDIQLDTITIPLGCSLSLALNNLQAISEAAVYNIISTGGCTTQPCGTIPPTVYSIKVSTNICNRVVNTVYFNGVDSLHLNTLLIPCDPGGAYCERRYAVCVDNNQTPPVYYTNYLGSTPYGSPSCTAGVPTLPPSGKSMDEYWDTGCFTTGCN
ncbi:MAG: hypothetical protein NTW25_07635 [Candidatus Kapabacteria bacterium]|nr:hypothetical protein [Candidatus Kapabacteria bacterium]